MGGYTQTIAQKWPSKNQDYLIKYAALLPRKQEKCVANLSALGQQLSDPSCKLGQQPPARLLARSAALIECISSYYKLIQIN